MTRACHALALTLLAAPLAALLAQPGYPPDDPDSWRVAGTAKVLCSALFVSGRDRRRRARTCRGYFLGAQARLDLRRSTWTGSASSSA